MDESIMVAFVPPSKLSKVIQWRDSTPRDIGEERERHTSVTSCMCPLYSLTSKCQRFPLNNWFGLVITSVPSPQAKLCPECLFAQHRWAYIFSSRFFIHFSILNRTSCEVCMKLNLLTKHSGFRDFVPSAGLVLHSYITRSGSPKAHFVPYFLGQEQLKLFFS